jgi:hypothetical protein
MATKPIQAIKVGRNHPKARLRILLVALTVFFPSSGAS